MEKVNLPNDIEHVYKLIQKLIKDNVIRQMEHAALLMTVMESGVNVEKYNEHLNKLKNSEDMEEIYDKYLKEFLEDEINSKER